MYTIYLWDVELLTPYGEFCRREALGFGTRLCTGARQMLGDLTEMLRSVGTTGWKGCKGIQTWLRKSTARSKRGGLLMWDGKWSTSGRKLSLVCRGREAQGCVRFQFPRWTHPAPTGQGHKWSVTDTRPITGGKIRTKPKVQVELPGSATGPVSWGSEIKEDSFITAVWSEWHLLWKGNLAQPLRVGLDKFKYLSKKEKGGWNVPITPAKERRGTWSLGYRRSGNGPRKYD